MFGALLYAYAHVRATEKTLEKLDWETLANITGEVGAGLQGEGLRSTAATQSFQASGDGAAQKNATMAGIASKIWSGC